jgi:hypothetical protein
MKLFKLLIVVATFAMAGAAQAQREPQPVRDREDIATAPDGKPLDAQALQKAVLAAGAKRQWRMAPAGDGKSIRGAYSWNNNKHTIMVDIVPTSSGYVVKYGDSVNMKYAVRDGVPVVHPFYYRHVDDLMQAIRSELARL